jgi:predicted nucleic acid-binding protein
MGSSVLLNFALIDRLDLLAGSNYAVHVPNHVLEEVRSADCRLRVTRALEERRLTELEITDLAETELYAKYRRRFGDGESAALAVGVMRRWAVAIDEKGPSRREVLERLGEEYLVTTPVLLKVGIERGLIQPAAIAEIRKELLLNKYVLELVHGEEASPKPTSSRI